MCDKAFSILKDFSFLLPPFTLSEQMYIEDKDDTDMYFKIQITEVTDANAGTIQFIGEDSAHGTINLSISKGAGVRKTTPMRIGTYGKKLAEGENTGLYIVLEVQPIQSNGSILYQTNIQFQIKGGE